MNQSGEWIDVGAADDFRLAPLREAKLGERLVAFSFTHATIERGGRKASQA